VLESKDCAVELCDLARMQPRRSLDEYDGVIVGGALHLGKHSRRQMQFAKESRQTLNQLPSAFFSVSLSAAGTEEQRQDATRCMNAFLRHCGWNPTATTIVAGAILYREYGFIKRWLMKRVVKQAGGDTDPSQNYVYTDWDNVVRFATQFADEIGMVRDELAYGTRAGRST